MKIFRELHSEKIICTVLLISILTGCDQISQGLQRKKFEFLYKMNNYSTLFREYTNGINLFNDIEFYDGRMKILYEDIAKVETVEGYGASRILKENFLTAIDENIKTINSFRQKSLKPTDNIKKEYDIIIMNERADKFIKELNEEISKVGKE